MHQRSGICDSGWKDTRRALILRVSYAVRRGSRFFRTLNKICDGLPDERDTLRVGVRANGTNLSEQLLSTLNHVCGERIFRGLNQFRVFGQCCDLQRRTG